MMLASFALAGPWHSATINTEPNGRQIVACSCPLGQDHYGALRCVTWRES